jgi:hypothetical protein
MLNKMLERIKTTRQSIPLSAARHGTSKSSRLVEIEIEIEIEIQLLADKDKRVAGRSREGLAASRWRV